MELVIILLVLLGSSTEAISVAGVIFGFIGLVSVVVATLATGLGARAKAVAATQSQAIEALNSELDAVKSRCDTAARDNQDLRNQLAEARGAIENLNKLVGARDLVEQVAARVEDLHAVVATGFSTLKKAS